MSLAIAGCFRMASYRRPASAASSQGGSNDPQYNITVQFLRAPVPLPLTTIGIKASISNACRRLEDCSGPGRRVTQQHSTPTAPINLPTQFRPATADEHWQPPEWYCPTDCHRDRPKLKPSLDPQPVLWDTHPTRLSWSDDRSISMGMLCTQSHIRTERQQQIY